MNSQETKAGHSYKEHAERGQWPKVPAKDANEAGQKLLDSILRDPDVKQAPITGGKIEGGTYYIRPNGDGAAFTPDGRFEYFGKFRY